MHLHTGDARIRLIDGAGHVVGQPKLKVLQTFFGISLLQDVKTV